MRAKSEPYIYRVAKADGVWHVLRNQAFYGDFLTEGDAVRAACFGARTEEARGHSAQVLAQPGDAPLAHYEPYFGL